MIQINFKAHIILLLSIMCLISCYEDKVIPEEKFILVYTDLLIAQDTVSANLHSIDSLKENVFRMHNISHEQYDETIATYNSSPEKWEQFFNKAIERVEKLKAESDSINFLED